MNYIRSNEIGPQGYGGYPWAGTGIMKNFSRLGI